MESSSVTQGQNEVHRRRWMIGVGAAALGGAVATVHGSWLPDVFASQNLRAVWLEWSDGLVYRHPVIMDQEGLWLDDLDGEMHLYEGFELTDHGIWLEQPDGEWHHFWCLTDDQAEHELI